MRDRWIDDLVRGPVDDRAIVAGRAEWTPTHGDPSQGRARIVLCQRGGRRLIGITISRFGRTLLRGLFDCTDVTVGSSTSNRVDLLIATGWGRSMSLLRVCGPGSERIAAFANG